MPGREIKELQRRVFELEHLVGRTFFSTRDAFENAILIYDIEVHAWRPAEGPDAITEIIVASTHHHDLAGLEDDDHPQYAQIAAAESITGLWTFNRAPNAPFAIEAGSADIPNFNADLVDGHHLDQDVLIASSPTFAALSIVGTITANILEGDHQGTTNLAGTSATEWQVNTESSDVDIILRFNRATGGQFLFTWNGVEPMTTNKGLKPNDLGIHRISDTEPPVPWAGEIWLDPSAAGGTGEGPQGPQGYQGTQGSQGTQGAQGAGAQGYQGYQGDAGVQGDQGEVGAQGSTGAQGNQGHQGSAGAQGTTGAQGSQGTQGTAGAQGPQGYQGEVTTAEAIKWAIIF